MMDLSIGGGGGGGEVRRVHVVYYLCRNGHLEHPHLIRVHHLHQNGVHLRDVKRWLCELRGKDMPETFSWSYKRRYKSGFVWQDLTDDDLITPFADNEFVLKGSDLRKNNHKNIPVGGLQEGIEVPPMKSIQETLDIEQHCNGASPNPPPRLDEESPAPVLARIFRIDESRQREEEQKKQEKSEPSLPEEQRPCFEGKSRTRAADFYAWSRRRALLLFHDLLRCKAAKADDSAQRQLRRRNSGELVSGRSLSLRRRLDGGNSNSGRKSHSRTSREGNTAAIYKPAREPNCLQCGKAFMSRKFHSHMKSCKGLRGSRN